MCEKTYELDSYEKGKKDRNNRHIEDIFYKSDSEIVVYFVKQDYINVYAELADDYSLNKPDEFKKLYVEIEERTVLKNKKSYKFVREGIADAIVKLDENDEEIALRYMNNVLTKIRNIEIREFVLGCGVSTALICIFALVVDYFSYIIKSKSYKEALCCICFSTLGNLLFHLLSLFKSEQKFEQLGYANGILNFLKSSISGLLIYMMIKSNLILGAFADNLTAILVFSLASGFNDDIPIQLITKISNQLISEEE